MLLGQHPPGQEDGVWKHVQLCISIPLRHLVCGFSDHFHHVLSKRQYDIYQLRDLN